MFAAPQRRRRRHRRNHRRLLVLTCRYHYFNVDAAYNTVRVTITAFVWLTGFGHLTFFSQPPPPSSSSSPVSVPRFLQTIWRLNFLAAALSLTMGNSFILYYVCALHTLQFLLVFGLMALGCVVVNTHHHTVLLKQSATCDYSCGGKNHRTTTLPSYPRVR
jgi:hypothetical protein